MRQFNRSIVCITFGFENVLKRVLRCALRWWRNYTTQDWKRLNTHLKQKWDNVSYHIRTDACCNTNERENSNNQQRYTYCPKWVCQKIGMKMRQYASTNINPRTSHWHVTETLICYLNYRIQYNPTPRYPMIVSVLRRMICYNIPDCICIIIPAARYMASTHMGLRKGDATRQSHSTALYEDHMDFDAPGNGETYRTLGRLINNLSSKTSHIQRQMQELDLYPSLFSLVD